MRSSNLLYYALLAAVAQTHAAAFDFRSENGVASTPPMGWNTYNHYACLPNEAIVQSNAKALVDLGLAPLGYRYVTTDCGWTVPDRTADGSLTWNSTIFPSGFPALGQFIHGLGLLFGVYEDSGIKTCMNGLPNQAGSLFNEAHDANTFAAWEIDSLKYDNCYSDAASGYPDATYTPATSPAPRYANMTNALHALNRTVLFQICEWGVDFPALWAPQLGNTWRIANDIIPVWRTIFRIVNQAVPSTSFAGPGHWPDLDMLEIGNGFFSNTEEQTHFSLWAILKSPLTIGTALKDAYTSINNASLTILKQKDVIAYNQDSLGASASLSRRYTPEQYDVWSGPLEGGKTVVALVNWLNTSRTLTLDLPDVGLQYAETLSNIWQGSSASNVLTTYSALVEPHGTMLLELANTVKAGSYPASTFATSSQGSTTFKDVYANTSSSYYSVEVAFKSAASQNTKATVQTNTGASTSVTIPKGQSSITAVVSLSAGSSNTVTVSSPMEVNSLSVTSPSGTYYPCTSFTTSGAASLVTCGSGFCKPVGSKIGNISPTGSASVNVPANVSSSGINPTSKYIEIDYINNDIAFSTAFSTGTNSRNLTISVNSAPPVRIEVPLTGRHSELFGPGLGWWDSATFGVLTPGWIQGTNKVVIGNVGGNEGVQSFGADFVGFRFYG